MIGDVHGCWRTLEALLAKMPIDFGRDRVWMVGDLINRGPGSLPTLRWAIENDAHLTTVLGNHELHLLAVEAGATRMRRKDTLAEILEAPDRDDLLAWVRTRPLVVQEDELLLVHAALRPHWTAADALVTGKAGEALLRGERMAETVGLLRNRDLLGAEPPAAIADLDFLTRARILDERALPRYDYTGPPESAPRGCQPWFEATPRAHSDHLVIFGHWAALGYRRGPDWLALDSGCVWGASLTAVRLDDGTVYQQPALDREAIAS